MRAFALFAVLVVVGCDKPVQTERSDEKDPKAFLKRPFDKKEFEKNILGRSTREVTELLGPPGQVLNGENRTGWVYPQHNGAIIFFRDDKAVEVG